LDYRGSRPLYLIIAKNGSNEDTDDVVQITLDGNMLITDFTNNTYPIKDIEQHGGHYNPRVNLDFGDSSITPVIPTRFKWGEYENGVTIAKVERGQTCGYRYTDITYAGDLILNVGQPITAMLDKLVQMLGN